MSVSISEIIVILVIALLVIKPEQMPEVAHALGRFVKSIRQMFASFKNEVNSLMDVKDAGDRKERKEQKE